MITTGRAGESFGEEEVGETGDDACDFPGEAMSSGPGTGTPFGRMGLLPTVYGVCGGIEFSRGGANEDRG